jgi:hypothetical protein
MRMSSLKAAFAIAITGIGCAMLLIDHRKVAGAACPSENCESCVFCSLATPACLDSCQAGCGLRPTDTADEAPREDESLLIGDVEEEEDAIPFEIENRELVCPSALDRAGSPSPAPSQR